MTATDVDNIVASSNLTITKTDAPDPVNPGQAVVYTVTVNNAGSFGRDEPRRLGHRAVAVHGDQRDVPDRLMRERGERRHVHPSRVCVGGRRRG